MKYDMKHAIKKPDVKPKKGRIVLIISLSTAALILAALVFFNFGNIRSYTSSLAAKIFQSPAEKEEPKEPQEPDGPADKMKSTDSGKDSDESGQSDEGKLPGSTEETADNNKTQVTAKDTIETSTSTEKEENTAPAIKLEVYEGPLYSPEDDICYYRVKAIVSGSPYPAVSFSKDDSLGSLGKGKAQINLKRNDAPYTLTAIASNIAGKASGKLILSWGCNIAPQIKAANLSSNIIYVSRQYDLTADAEDPDGDAIQYDWSANAGLIAQNSANPAKWTSPDAPGEYIITLVASDNHGNKSSPYTIKVSVKAKAEPISKSTSMVGYQEVSAEQLVGLFVKRNPSKTERAARLAPMYINYGKMFNIRADIAWAQMCHETNFLEYTGDVKPGQNNFAGIGATGGGEPGNSFATEELGIIAHFAHLAWYYFPDHVNKYCSLEYDPRHFDNVHKYYNGDTSLGFLKGRWATDTNYADKIAQFANEIYGN